MDLYIDKIMDNINNPKPEFSQLNRKVFTQFVNFPSFNLKEWVRYVLSRVHVECIWMENPYKINVEATKAVTCLHQISKKVGLQKVTNLVVNKLTSVEFDGQSMKISTIREDDVRFSTMVIGNNVYQSNRLNSIFGTTIHVAYKMVKEDSHYDLCSVLLEELLNNLKKIKQDKKTCLQVWIIDYLSCPIFHESNP